MDAIIRKATCSDLEAILALYAEIDNRQKRDLYDAVPVFGWMKQYPDYTLYVTEAGNRVAGVCALLIMDNLAHRGACPEYYLNIPAQ